MIYALLLLLIISVISAESLYKAYVINLPSRKNRLESIDLQLKQYEIPYEVFPAVTPAEILEVRNNLSKGLGLGARFDPQTKMNFYHQAPKPTELGCLQSHVQILFKIANSNSTEPVLILEDDAKFEPNFYNRSVDLMKRIKSEWDILHVGYCLEPSVNRLCDTKGERGPDYCKFRNQILFCAQAYFINGSKAAKTILNYVNTKNPSTYDYVLGFSTDKYFISLPKLAKQFPFQSDNHNLISHWK